MVFPFTNGTAQYSSFDHNTPLVPLSRAKYHVIARQTVAQSRSNLKFARKPPLFSRFEVKSGPYAPQFLATACNRAIFESVPATTDLLTVNDIAQRHGVTKNTVRNWCKSFEKYLSTEASGRPRQFTEADQQVFALIADMRQEHRPYDDIHAALANEQHLEVEIPAPGKTTLTETGQQETALAPYDLVQQLITDIQEAVTAEVRKTYEGQVERLDKDKDKLEKQLVEERKARLEAEKRAATAEATLEAQKNSQKKFDKLMDARNKMAGEQKPWWKFWT